MIKFNIMPMLRAKGRTKYWLYEQMNMNYRSFNRMASGETKFIRSETIETLCQILECPPNELFIIDTTLPEA